ncbi:class I SAM-dependent methyltransferase [Chloroflexota bacterium]
MDYRKRVYDVYVSAHFQHLYSLVPEQYEHLTKVYHRRFLPKDRDAKIIGLACGARHFLYFLQKEGYVTARGIDISQQQVDIARQMGVKNIEVGNFWEVLATSKDEFDFISANDIIEHQRKAEVLDLVYAALKPRGRILMTTGNPGSLFGAIVAFSDLTHETAFTPESLAQVFRVCGFENVAVYGEEPVAHDLLSAIRLILWKMVKALFQAYLLMEGRFGFGIWRGHVIVEPRILAVGYKPCQ